MSKPPTTNQRDNMVTNKMFSNQKIGTWVVEQVPCSFAKPGPNGEIGTHYAMVLLDKEMNIVHVGSECEDKHGEGIQAIHELGDGNTCFSVSDTVRQLLGQLRNNQTVTLRSDLFPVKDKTMSPITRELLRTVWRTAVAKHNQRVNTHNNPSIDTTGFKVQALHNAANRVANRLLRPRQEENAEQIFTVTPLRYLLSSSFIKEQEHAKNSGVPLITLEFKNAPVPFAVRHEGQWSFEEDIVKRWAAKNHNTNSNSDYCIFCGEYYNRMRRHTEGAKHINRVVEVARMVCRSTSSFGLRMLNDPRHRNIF